MEDPNLQKQTTQSNSLTSASARKKVRDDDIVEAEADKSVAEVNALFAKVDDRRQKREVPSYVFGKISFDPVTRTKLTQDMLIPNYAMKEVVDDFVSKNEWSLYY